MLNSPNYLNRILQMFGAVLIWSSSSSTSFSEKEVITKAVIIADKPKQQSFLKTESLNCVAVLFLKARGYF